MNWGAQFDVGMFQFRFQRGGAQWHGTILASTTPLFNDDRWLLYYSQLGVPETDDGSVHRALTECWNAYDSSKAQSQAGAAAVQAQKESGQRSADAIKAQQETSALLAELHETRQATFDDHHAAWLRLMRQ
jgi:hypothetical protein